MLDPVSTGHDHADSRRVESLPPRPPCHLDDIRIVVRCIPALRVLHRRLDYDQARREIDPRGQSARAADNFKTARSKGGLDRLPVTRRQPCMVIGNAKLCQRQILFVLEQNVGSGLGAALSHLFRQAQCRVLRAAACRTKDEHGHAPRMLLYETRQVLIQCRLEKKLVTIPYRVADHVSFQLHGSGLFSKLEPGCWATIGTFEPKTC